MHSRTPFRPNATALITGAAAGIGRGFAQLCASHSMNLILVDNDESALNETRLELMKTTSRNVYAWQMDVSSFAAWHALKTHFQHTPLHILHLNAGVGCEARWQDHEAFEKIMGVNYFGVTNGINTFFDEFDQNYGEQKAIIISGSKQGITNPPGNPAYNASKSAVNALAEHLHFDLSSTSPNTAVHLLVPGWTWTPMNGSRKTNTKPDGAWTPQQTVDFLFEKMQEGRFYVICPDNEVDSTTDQRRMMWAMGDKIFGRAPLSRWRKEYEDEAINAMDQMDFSNREAV